MPTKTRAKAKPTRQANLPTFPAISAHTPIPPGPTDAELLADVDPELASSEPWNRSQPVTPAVMVDQIHRLAFELGHLSHCLKSLPRKNTRKAQASWQAARPTAGSCAPWTYSYLPVFVTLIEARANWISEASQAVARQLGESFKRPLELARVIRLRMQEVTDELADVPCSPDQDTDQPYPSAEWRETARVIGSDLLPKTLKLKRLLATIPPVEAEALETTETVFQHRETVPDAHAKESRNVCRHDNNFRNVVWFGQEYRFTPMQGQCVAALWSAFETGLPDKPDQETLADAGSYMGQGARVPRRRLRPLFQKGKFMHPAWGTMIVEGDTKGTHRLQPLA